MDDRYANSLVTYQRSVAIVQPCQQRAGSVVTREGTEAARVQDLSISTDLATHRRLQQQGGAAAAAVAHPVRPERHRPERGPAGGSCFELRDATFRAVPSLLMKCGEGCSCRP